MKILTTLTAGLFVTAGLVPVAGAENAPSNEELWDVIQKQSEEIEQLKGDVAKTDKKVEATADAVEATGSGSKSKTTIGGYGELHLNKLKNNLDGGADKDEIDLHRFVLFVGHEFSESVRFFSELEIEHALVGGSKVGNDGKPGEVEIEQAYVEFDFSQNHRGKAGLFLVPVGIINETHEPNTFYGVERNNVEKAIIPSTWWEAGAAASGQFAPGLSYDFALHSGLYSDDGAIRGGRQKVAKAKADDFAATARLKYTGISGLELAATIQQQGDMFQGETVVGSEGAVSGMGATLVEAHAAYQGGMFGLRALYAVWSLDSAINTINDGADEQYGYYIEPSLRLSDSWGFFVRYSEWDKNAGSSVDTKFIQADIGFNYWLTDGVVFKADYQTQDKPTGQDEYDGFNLGVGWSF